MNDGHPEGAARPRRARLNAIIVWLAIFSLPLLLFTCDSPKIESYVPIYSNTATGK